MLKYRYLKSGTNHTRKQSFADTATLDHQKSPVIVGGQSQASVGQWEVALQMSYPAGGTRTTHISERRVALSHQGCQHTQNNNKTKVIPV